MMYENMKFDNWATATTNLNEFAATITALTNAGRWEAGLVSKDLVTQAIDGPINAPEVEELCKCDKETAFDTCENSHILMKVGLDTYCVRNTAIPSLFDTAKIQGSALGRLEPASLSEVVNRCLQVAKGSSLILFRAGKITAIMSDNAGGYRIMPQKDLLEIALEKITKRFGFPDFKSGVVDHAVSTFVVELPNAQKRLNDIYNGVIRPSGRTLELMPAVIFSTSDTGRSAATLKPVFRLMNDNFYYPINNGLRVDHIRSKDKDADGLEKFAKLAGELHAKFNETQETIGRMAQTVLNYPLNAYIAIAKKIGVAQKYAKSGYEDLEAYCGGAPCSAHDVYLSLTRCFDAAAINGSSNSVRLALEDAVARVLTLRWEDYDLPGVVSWGKAA